MQIQGALLALGYVSAEPAKAPKAHAEYIPKLAPNTDTLAKYLEYKHRENPKAKEFAALYREAKTLSEQVTLAAPIIALPGITGCEISSYGKAGKELPKLFRDATEVLLPGVNISVDQVVFIEDYDRWASCQHLSLKNAKRIHDSFRMYVVSRDFPIYVIGDRQDIREAMNYYEKGSTYLKYTVARWYSHDWQHAALHEQGELPAYEFEAMVIQTYLESGKLPRECEADLLETQAQIAREKAKLKKGETPYFELLVPAGRHNVIQAPGHSQP